jgi:hypothetical protein
MIALELPFVSSTGVTVDAAAVSGGRAAPQRQVVTLRGTRRPHDGHTRLEPAGSWLAFSEAEGLVLSEVEGSGMSHNEKLNRR